MTVPAITECNPSFDNDDILSRLIMEKPSLGRFYSARAQATFCTSCRLCNFELVAANEDSADVVTVVAGVTAVAADVRRRYAATV